MPHAGILGYAEFQELESHFAELTPDQVEKVAVDLMRASSIARQVAELIAGPDLRPRFESASGFDPAHIARLPKLALAAWFTRGQLTAAQLGPSHADLPAELMAEAFALKDRMLLVANYWLDGRAEELKGIAAGTGYLDLADDLKRLSQIFVEEQKTLSQDPRRYKATDAADAKAAGDRILRLTGPDLEVSQWVDLNARVYTQLKRAYRSVRDTAVVIFRDEPKILEHIPPLFGST